MVGPSSRTSCRTSRRNPSSSASGWPGSKIPVYTQRPMCSTNEPNRRRSTAPMEKSGSTAIRPDAMRPPPLRPPYPVYNVENILVNRRRQIHPALTDVAAISGQDGQRTAREGAVAVSLKDVAQVAGVSIKTVSNVVHDYPFVSTETRARVQSVI